MPVEYLDSRVLNCQDNEHALAELPSDSIDLIYLDPPFFSNRYYEVIWGDEAEIRSFEDRWDGGMQVYIDWMRRRAAHLYRVLSPTGSLYLHCDPHASHYLKVMLDELFGSLESFRSEIVWKRSGSHNSAKRWGPVHDIILFYTKSKTYTWNAEYQPYDPAYIESHFKMLDERGRFQGVALTGPGRRAGESGLPWRGVDPSKNGRHWQVPSMLYDLYLRVTGEELAQFPLRERLDRADAAGLIYWPPGGRGVPRFKQYESISRGLPVQDVITDIGPLNSQARERLGYPTQKPESLISRIVKASSNKGDMVLDPFCGCGTTVSVAEQLGRRWIGIDISPTAVNLMKNRMSRIMNVNEIKVMGIPDSPEMLRVLKPFEFQNWVIQKFVGTHSPRKSGDMGIDGYSFMERNPIQVKRSDNVGRNVVDNFETAIRRGGHEAGYIVAFSFTRGAREEAARARVYDGLDIRLLTVADLLKPQLQDRVPELATVIELPMPPSRSIDALPTPEELIESDLAS